MLLAELVLPLLEVGEPGNEHYDPELFAFQFYTLLLERGLTIRYEDYVTILTAAQGECCQHTESTACNKFRCSCHVSDFLQVELQNLTHFQTICFWQGQMNTVAKLHTIFNNMASSIYGKSFSLIDLYGADADKKRCAEHTISAMRHMQEYILQKFDHNTLEKWLQSAAEWQCEQSKGAYCRLVCEHLGVELDLGEALQRMSMH